MQSGSVEKSEKLISQAAAQFSSGSLDAAADLCRTALEKMPGQPDALHLLGLIAYQSGDCASAADHIKQALTGKPENPLYHYHLGIALADEGDQSAAELSYRAAIHFNPGYTEALNNLGLIHFDTDRLESAALLFKDALRVQPRFTNAMYNLGMTLQALAMPLQALSVYDRVLELMPDSAETRFNRAACLLQTGRFEAGWHDYEFRFQGKTNDHCIAGSKRWDGRYFRDQRLLVLDEQGIGDTLQFIRYLPMVKERGGTVIFRSVSSLLELLDGFPGIDELYHSDQTDGKRVAADWFIPLMSLPMIFRTGFDNIPAAIPYVFPKSEKAARWNKRISEGRFKVGLVWAGRPTANYESSQSAGAAANQLKLSGVPASRIAGSRSRRLDLFKPLANIPGLQLYGLQKGPEAVQADDLAEEMGIISLGPEFSDFADTAAAIDALDLVVSVDTSVAHLAGAMGKPVWVLLPHAPDWRWMLERQDSPWYPGMRLFRQQRRGEWRPVFERVAAELRRVVQQKAVK